MKYLLILFTLFLAFSCGKVDETCAATEKEDCICTLEYDPVCGCNGISYGNKCVAACSSISDYKEGECP